MGLEIVIDIIESKVRELESKEENITDAIDKAQNFLSCVYMTANNKLRDKFSEYATDYTKSYFFSKRDPSFKRITDIHDSTRKEFDQMAVYTARLGAIAVSYLTINQFIDTQTVLLLGSILASVGIGIIAGKIEHNTHYIGDKLNKLLGIDNYYGTKDYNKKLRKKLSTEIIKYEKTIQFLK